MSDDERPRAVKHFLEPLRGEPKNRPFLVFDIESKHDDTQKRGFTRPFMSGFYDGLKFNAFYNDENVATLPWAERCIARGGCIDKMMRHIFGQTADGRYDFIYRDHDIYAHNLGAFDGLFLPAWLERNNNWISYKLMPVQSRIQMIEMWRFTPQRPRRTREERKKADTKDRKMGCVRFLDSFKIMPISLDKVIKMFKLRADGQGKLEIDLDLPEWDREKWDEYNKVDTVMLFQAMQKYQTLIQDMGGEVGMTAPSTAVKLLRRKYMADDLKIHRNIHFLECKDDACTGCAHDFFRTAYHGGRTEVYQFRGQGYYYDVNSSYPFSMKKPMPIGELTSTGENEDFTKYANDHYVGFVRCTVEIPDSVYLPPLPVYMDGKLKFPVGRFSGTWDWVELRALQRIGGKIVHVEKAAWIRAQRFMVDFVESLYKMRNKNDPNWDAGRDETAKIMMNSTFGKFGMEQERMEIVILKPGEDEPHGVRFPGESIGHWEKRKTDENVRRSETQISGSQASSQGMRMPDLKVPSGAYEHESLVRIKDTQIDAPYIIPQIAAHITACSRMLLWHYSMDILDLGGKIFYSDTDSILTDYGGLEDSKVLGGLKKEYQEIVTLICYGPKMYILEKPTPFKGEHIKGESSEGAAGAPKCLEHCPGCMTDPKGKTISGVHQVDKDGVKNCVKKCPGCACYKVMMKGVPRDLRTRTTMENMNAGQEVSFQLHEKLGALAKSGFKRTPLMVNVKKSVKSSYDKRTLCLDQNDTLPINLGEPRYLTQKFIDAASKPDYAVPPWLLKIFEQTPNFDPKAN